MSFAGFWRRFLAAIIDCFISSICLSFIHALVGIPIVRYVYVHQLATPEQLSAYYSSPEVVFASTLSILFSWLYGAIFMSSKWQGTPGMKALHMKVVDYDGKRISFEQASIRYIGFIISAFTLGIGFIIIAFTRHKQAIQDFVARTYVVKS